MAHSSIHLTGLITSPLPHYLQSIEFWVSALDPPVVV